MMISIWGRQTNLFYNANNSNNGGGYFQYEGGALFCNDENRENYLVIEVDDSSCMDFGDRYIIDVYTKDYRWTFHKDSVNEYQDDSDEVDREEDFMDVCEVLGEDIYELIMLVKYETSTLADDLWAYN